MRKKLLSILALLCLTVSSAWAQDFDLKGDDTWDEDTKTLTVNGNPERNAYSNVSDIENLVISSSVTSIGDNAFDYCTGLTSVTIGNSVTSIGMCAFSYCTGLTSVTIGNSVEYIGDYAFDNTGLTSVTIPNSVTSIGEGAFNECSGLTSITIPNSVTSIGDGAFQSCSGLTSMVVASENTKYDSRESCNAIIETASNTLIFGCKNTIIPNSVTSIGARAFYECTGLTSVTIGNSVTSIGDNAFDYCTGLTSVTIGNSVTSIGGYAFQSCSGLTSITIPNNVTSIGGFAFQSCTGLTSVTIGNSVTSIGMRAFQSCSSLTSVILNSNPTIGAVAFPASATVTMNLTANAAGGAYWMTFYNQNYDFEADANTQVFKAALTGTELELTELTTDKTVTKNNAVILKSTASPIVMTLTSTASINDFSGNSLQGVPAAAGLTAADPSTTFVLNNGTGGVGFYRLKSGKTLGVGKAYLTYAGAFARGYFLFDETTGIEMPTVEGNGDAEAVVYDLQGRRVLNPTKGLYIVNGKKVFINK